MSHLDHMYLMCPTCRVPDRRWLTADDTAPDDVLTPERLGDEHRLIAQTAREFVANEVVPAVPRARAERTGRSRGS